MTEELCTGTIIEVDTRLYGFELAVILYFIPPDHVEVTPFINGRIPRAGGTIPTTDVVKIIKYLEPEEFVLLEGRYLKEYLEACLKK